MPDSLRGASPPTRLLSAEDFVRNLLDSGLLVAEDVERALAALPSVADPADGAALAHAFVQAGRLTAYQVEQVRNRNFQAVLVGNYEVLDHIGAGGMGTVYKARHRRMKRVVALKVLARNLAQSTAFIQRFQREVEAAARLSHPHIVMAFDADEAEVGHFLVMEFVNGRDLATEVQDRGRLTAREAIDCVVQAAQALAYAHGEGVIHRDIKPANLLRDVNGVVKVADLGLARINNPLGGDSGRITQAGRMMGTVDFMPPEQALDSASTDHRADIYSLGCTLYFLLVGGAPYEAETLTAALLKHQNAPIPSLAGARPGLPPALDAVFRRMVAKKPEDRFQSMAEVVHALQAVEIGPEPAPAPAATSSPAPAAGLPTVAAPATGMGQTTDMPAAFPNALAGLKVLLAEPSRTQSGIIRKLLQEKGVQDITTTASGAQALDLARGTRPGAVVSSMHLTDMTGMQLLQRLRAEDGLASTGFVLITSQAEAEADILASAVRTARLHKPFDAVRLAQALSACTAASPPRSQPLRTLIVDDSAAARRHVRAVLIRLGIGLFTEAADGAQAVGLLRSERFDLVVTDYNMPHLDGRGLIDFIRNRSSTPAVPVILVTTETDPGKLDAVRQLGVSAICDKTFSPEAVRGVIAGLVPHTSPTR